MGNVYDAIMGFVVGDALGVPVEFEERDTYKVLDMIGYGTHEQPAGTWSDDSSMTLATLESISRLSRIDAQDIMNNFALWISENQFTAYDEVFDIGKTTRQAVLKYIKGVPLVECGGQSEWDNGNGSLMRILPLAFCKNLTQEMIADISSLTHGHEISIEACEIYIAIANIILNEKNAKEKLMVLEKYIAVSPKFGRILQLHTMQRDEIESTGYVVDTLEAALWCLMHSNSYKECVLLAVNLGDDTDTIAAIAGGLAGLLYGSRTEVGIPKEWIAQIAKKEWIATMCQQFEECINK